MVKLHQIYSNEDGHYFEVTRVCDNEIELKSIKTGAVVKISIEDLEYFIREKIFSVVKPDNKGTWEYSL